MAKVLVTGAEGFLGRALCDVLRREGGDVVGLSRRNGDVADPATFGSLRNFDHIFHLAARTFVPDSWKDPAGFQAANVAGTTNVLELCRRSGARMTFISAYLYGQPQALPVSEQHVVRPNNPYAMSKWLAEEQCRFYAAHMGVNVTVLRPFNVYGPGQAPHFLIPEIVRQVRTGPMVRLKDLEPRRDYVHVDDVVAAMVGTMACRESFDILNIGSGESMSVAEIVATIQEAAGTSLPVVQDGETRTNEIPDVRADISRALQVLAWEPRVTFREGIRRMLQEEVLS